MSAIIIADFKFLLLSLLAKAIEGSLTDLWQLATYETFVQFLKTLLPAIGI